jgi:excisionase family DNA binding protein
MNPKGNAAQLASFRLLFGKQETAQILGVSTRTVEGLLYRGVLPAIRIGRRVLFHKKTIEAFARCDH